MSIKKAIELAVEQGYERPEPCEIEGNEVYHQGDTFLDPKFWQSLGKALGWKKDTCDICYTPYDSIELTFKCECGFLNDNDIWRKNWHRFIDHLADGKDPEDFFNQILTKDIR